MQLSALSISFKVEISIKSRDSEDYRRRWGEGVHKRKDNRNVGSRGSQNQRPLNELEISPKFETSR